MRTWTWLFVGLALTDARADDPLEVRERAAERSLLLGPDRPWLRLAPMLGGSLEGLGAIEEHAAHTLALGRRVRLRVEGARVTNEIDLASRGWRADAQLAIDLGPVRLDVGTTVRHIDTRLGRGTYQLSGLALTRVFSLSPTMTTWISLAAGERRWLDAEGVYPGEVSATELQLQIGTTFP